MKRPFRFAAVVLACTSLASGCALLRPQPDETKYFVLSPLAEPTGKSFDRVVGVGPFFFPDYLGRPQIARRKTPNQMRYAPDRYWAEPLDENFARVVSENIGILLGTEKVVTLPAQRRTNLDVEVAIEVLRFEPTHENEVSLFARWLVRAGKDRHFVTARESRIREPLDGDTGNAWARGMSRAALQLSQEIAAALESAEP